MTGLLKLTSNLGTNCSKGYFCGRWWCFWRLHDQIFSKSTHITVCANNVLTSKSVQRGRSKWYSPGWSELLGEARVDGSEPNGLMYRSSELALRRSGGKMVAGIVIPCIPTLSIEVDVPWNVFILGYARFALISPCFALKRKR